MAAGLAVAVMPSLAGARPGSRVPPDLELGERIEPNPEREDRSCSSRRPARRSTATTSTTGCASALRGSRGHVRPIPPSPNLLKASGSTSRTSLPAGLKIDGHHTPPATAPTQSAARCRQPPISTTANPNDTGTLRRLPPLGGRSRRRARRARDRHQHHRKIDQCRIPSADARRQPGRAHRADRRRPERRVPLAGSRRSRTTAIPGPA